MRKQNRFTSHEATELHLTEDLDELQSLDEHDSHWVEAWKNAAKKLAELRGHVIHPMKRVRV